MSKHGAALLLERETYRIGEVASLARVEAHVLRYWETEFPALRPAKTPSGQRLYRQTDVDTVLAIKRLLYEEGFTIAGARKQLGSGNGHSDPEVTPEARAADASGGNPMRETLRAVRDELAALLTLLSRR